MDISQWMDTMLRNLRLAGRTLAKTPGFSATVIVTLALGIGANSAVFSAINAVLLRPLPFPNANRLVRVTQLHPKLPQPLLAAIRLEEWNRMNHTSKRSAAITNRMTPRSPVIFRKRSRALLWRPVSYTSWVSRPR